MILGTAAYLSPEQVATGAADPRSDVYSVGVVAFELLTGRPPFGGDSPLAVAYQHVHRDVPAPSAWAPGIPPALDALVLRATRRDPALRPADAGELAVELAALRRSLGVPVVRVPAPVRSATHPAPPPRGATMVEPRAGGTGVLPRTTAPHDGRPGSATDLETGVGPRGGQPWVDARRRGRRTAAVWLVVVALLAAAVGAGAWVVGTDVVAVPAVAGLDREAATRVLADAHLTAVVATGYDDTAPVGAAVGTEPGPGARVDEGARVTLRVSTGRPRVPDVAAGSSVADAEQQLRAASLVPVAGRDDYSDTVAVGTVLALDPAPGAVLAVGSPVAVARSLGVRPVAVPDVAGRDEASARAALNAAGLAVAGVDRVFDAAVDGGRTTGTDVAAGSVVPAGSSVRLRVSDAVTVPSVRGVTVGRARAALDAAGLGVSVTQLFPTDAGLVLTQSPSGGRVEPGTTVRLTALP
jgi:serine/threonine-protein kinase